MGKIRRIIIWICIIHFSIAALYGQDHFLFTRKFDQKLERYQLEFFQPIERWLKPSPVTKDDFLKYDIVLHSDAEFELRIIIDGADQKQISHPHVLITSTLASIASNEDGDMIRIIKLPDQHALHVYGADGVLFADFRPKPAFSKFDKGRMVSQYRAGKALINYIILFRGELDPFFEMPIRFRS